MAKAKTGEMAASTSVDPTAVPPEQPVVMGLVAVPVVETGGYKLVLRLTDGSVRDVCDGNGRPIAFWVVR